MNHEELKQWNGVYSIAVDQLCAAAGIREIDSNAPGWRSVSCQIHENTTMEGLKTFLVKALQLQGFTGLRRASVYKMQDVIGDDHFLYVVLSGEFP